MRYIIFVMMNMFLISHGEGLPSGYRFHQTIDTLNTIREIITDHKTGAYLRFGDGDLNLAYGKVDMMQNPNQKLQQEMREAFALNGPTILKCLPLYCQEFGGYEEGMSSGNHLADVVGSQLFLDWAMPIWGAPISDVYSHVALCFAATQYPKECFKFLSFLRTQNIILIGNQFIPESVRAILFGRDSIFIPAPAMQSYNAIDYLEKEALNAARSLKGYKVIVTSMGCSGRPLQKRLLQKLDDAFLFDFGSLMDTFFGFQSREWMNVTRFNGIDFLQKYAHYLSEKSLK